MTTLIDILEADNARLRDENAKLRKAAQAVVDTARRAKSQQVTYHYLPEIDSLAAVLEGVETTNTIGDRE